MSELNRKDKANRLSRRIPVDVNQWTGKNQGAGEFPILPGPTPTPFRAGPKAQRKPRKRTQICRSKECQFARVLPTVVYQVQVENASYTVRIVDSQ